MTFSIKPSHRLVNPSPVEVYKAPSYFDPKYPLLSSQSNPTSVVTRKPSTNTDSKVRTGSLGGMAIRTSSYNATCDYM
jgi:hypothetical protein